jgi:NAD-dependent SIR2 family protein deacetylase
MTAILVGAGFSKATYGIPTMKGMVDEFPIWMNNHSDEIYNLLRDESKNILEYYYEMKKAIDFAYDSTKQELDIEAILSILDMISKQNIPENIAKNPGLKLLLHRKGMDLSVMIREVISEIGIEKATVMSKAFSIFLFNICDTREVKKDISNLDLLFEALLGEDKLHDTLEQHRKDPKQGVMNRSMDIFTTNYDNGLEKYCHSCQLAYHTGIEYNQIYDSLINVKETSQLFQSNAIRIIKLHGSIDWWRCEDGYLRHMDPKLVLKNVSNYYGHIAHENQLLYPALGKSIYQLPYSDMFQRLRGVIRNDKPFIIIGHSCRDEDIVAIVREAIMKSIEDKHYTQIAVLDPDANSIVSRLGLPNTTPINKEITIESINEIKQFVKINRRQ